MLNSKKILAVITARGGSKRLKNKNITKLNGKPLIAWTIEEAKKSIFIDKLIVSSDDQEIIAVSKVYGAEVPFVRPEELASDKADTYSVLEHAINFFKEEYEYILLLQPTSPLRKCEDIDNAILSLNSNVKAVVSVTETDHSPLWSNTLPDDLNMSSFIRKDVKNKRAQDLSQYYRLNGAIYISEINYFLFNKSFFGDKTKALIMSKENSIDIDDEFDLLMASFFMNKTKTL